MRYLSMLKDRLREYTAKYFEEVELFEFKFRDFGWCKPDATIPVPTSFKQIENFLADDIIVPQYLENEMFHDPDYLFAYNFCEQKGLFHKIHLKTSRGGAIDTALITIMISFRVLFLLIWKQGLTRDNFLEQINKIKDIKRDLY